LKLPTPVCKDNSVWKEFVSQCVSAADPAQATWEFVKNSESNKKLEQENKFDPFSYKFDSSKGLIVLHFGGDNKSIDIKNSSYLRRKLKIMFDEIRVSHPDATRVEAYSWMIKFAARIFPKEFIDSAVPQQGWFKTEAVWGQFKTVSGMREKVVQVFLDKVEKAANNQDLQNAFPYQSLHAICDIECFYEMSL